MNDKTQATVPAKAEMRSGGAIQAFVPQNFEEAWRIATTVVEAGMAPQGLNTAAKVMVAIMHGQEVGFTPMAALQSIAVINGRPTIWGDGALGLVQGSGRLEWIKEVIAGENDARTATCTVKRFGDVEIKTGKFSVADAKAAGLWGKAGPWKQYSDRMLKMRARSWALRDGFSDVLKGLGVAEEVQDFPPERVEHTVVSSEPHTQPAQEAEVKMPSVVKAAEPVQPAQPASHTAPVVGEVFTDTVEKVHEAPADKEGKIKYGVQVKSLGSKLLLGTYEAKFVSLARRALEDGKQVKVVYSQEGKFAKLESLELVGAE